MGYYLYLPAIFIHHDLGLKDFAWVNSMLETYKNTGYFYQASMGPLGVYVMKYSSGLAILNLPFFACGHLIAKFFGYTADGFSCPYQYSIAIGGLIYTLIGLFFITKSLLHYFNLRIVTICIFTLVFATNYFQLTTEYNTMQHNVLFALNAILIFCVIFWFESGRLKYLIGISITTAFLIITRPSEMVVIVIPAICFIQKLFAVKITGLRIILNIKKYGLHIVLAMFVFLAICSVQLIYWKIYTGKFFYFSYTDPAQGFFDFKQPHIADILFNYRNGWLVYTPVIYLSLLGFVFLYFKRSKIRIFFWPFLIYFILNLFLLSSWTYWWFASSMGNRAFMQSYAFLIFPMAAFFNFVFSKKIIFRVLLLLCLLFFCWLNLFQNWQIRRFGIDCQRLTKEYYWAIFGKTNAPAGANNLLSFDYGQTSDALWEDTLKLNKKRLVYEDYEPSEFNVNNLFKHSTLHSHSGKYSYRLDSSENFSPLFKFNWPEIITGDYAIIVANAYVFPSADVENNPAKLVGTFNWKGTNFCYNALNIDDTINHIKAGQWNKVSLIFTTSRSNSDEVQLFVYFWLRGKKEIFIDDFSVDVYRPE
jgi:hypothetical protein